VTENDKGGWEEGLALEFHDERKPLEHPELQSFQSLGLTCLPNDSNLVARFTYFKGNGIHFRINPIEYGDENVDDENVGDHHVTTQGENGNEDLTPPLINMVVGGKTLPYIAHVIGMIQCPTGHGS